MILDPDVTFNQWKDFLLNKYIPAVEREFQGDLKLSFTKGIRGEDANGVSFLWAFKSVEVRDKYFNQDGSFKELFNSKWDKLQPIQEELDKQGIFSRKHYTDWLIQ